MKVLACYELWVKGTNVLAASGDIVFEMTKLDLAGLTWLRSEIKKGVIASRGKHCSEHEFSDVVFRSITRLDD